MIVDKTQGHAVGFEAGRRAILFSDDEIGVSCGEDFGGCVLSIDLDAGERDETIGHHPAHFARPLTQRVDGHVVCEVMLDPWSQFVCKRGGVFAVTGDVADENTCVVRGTVDEVEIAALPVGLFLPGGDVEGPLFVDLCVGH